MDIKSIYIHLLKNGFYDNIFIKVCSRLKEDDSLEIHAECKDNGVKKIKNIACLNYIYPLVESGENPPYCTKKSLIAS
jgi:hypothetical protein